MSWLEEHREKKIRKENQRYADEQKKIFERAKTDDQGRKSIEAYISPKKIIRKLFPYLILSFFLFPCIAHHIPVIRKARGHYAAI